MLFLFGFEVQLAGSEFLNYDTELGLLLLVEVLDFRVSCEADLSAVCCDAFLEFAYDGLEFRIHRCSLAAGCRARNLEVL